MGLSIIGAGLGRTGTLSLKLALEHLGASPCCHMFELIEHYDRVPYWVKAARGEPVDWNQVFAGFVATVDWPGASFYRQLAEHFPQAKVILTVRDPDMWFDSTQETIAPVMTKLAADTSVPHGAMMRDIILNVFGGSFDSREHCIGVYNAHNEEVKRTISSDRLLVMNVAEGWKPLCDFLGVSVPPHAFPRVNDRMEFKQVITGHLGRLSAKLIC